MKIAVIGTEYVGLVIGTCFAEWGNRVVCVDKNADKVADLRHGRMPIYEPDLDELVERNYAAGRLDFSCDLAMSVEGAAIVFIAVGTMPHLGQEGADASLLYVAARELAPLISVNTVVVIKSTVPIGTGDAVQRIIGTVRAASTFAVVSNPEFLREGIAVRDFLAPDRIVLGLEDEWAYKRLIELYDVAIERRNTPVIITMRRTAELIKHAANAFLATKVTFINELADLCEEMGSDVGELALGMGLDKRIGASLLAAGPGYGGSCFPKGALALLQTAQEHGVALRIVEETLAANEARKRRMARKVTEALGGNIDGLIIAVLGLTFRPDTDDMRDAPSIPLIETLQRLGARIQAYDPLGNENAAKVLNSVDFYEDLYECARNADAVVVVTEWDAIRKIDLAQLKQKVRQPVLIDLRNALDMEAARQIGFRVCTIGRSASEQKGLQDIAKRRTRQRSTRPTTARPVPITIREK